MRVVVSAAEPSGDILAAELIAQIKSALPEAVFSGMGGEKTKQAGCECVADSAALSVMGYADVFAKLPRILSARAAMLAEIARRRPALFVGIDAPDFNIPLAARARKCGCKTAQYGSPTVWMWRSQRIKTIAAAVEQIWCMLPFEPECYKNAATTALFAGHPLAAKKPVARTDARQQLNIGENAEVFALLPGSRPQELKEHLPLTAQTVSLLQKNNGNRNRVFVSAAADKNAEAKLNNFLPGCILAPSAAIALAAADVAAVKSGTVALEAALAQTPSVVFYRPSRAAEFTARLRRFYLPFFSLPNILAGKFVAPEFIGANEARPEHIAAEMEKLAREQPRRETMRAAFAPMRAMLSSQNSAADFALAMLKQK